MGSVSVQVQLGGVAYTVPKMNIGQLRQTTKLSARSAAALKDDPASMQAIETGIETLKIAMSRATPTLPDLDAVECDIEEIGEAVVAILSMNRRPKAPGEENPPASLQSPGGTIGTTSTAD